MRTTNIIANKTPTLNGRRQPALSSRYKVKKISQDSEETNVLIQYFINEVMDENNQPKKDHIKFMVEVYKSDLMNQFDEETQEDSAMKAKFDAMSSAAIQIEAAMSTAAAFSSENEMSAEDKAAADMQHQLNAISAAAAQKAAEIEESLNVESYEKEALDYGKIAAAAEQKVSYLENAMKMATMSDTYQFSEDDEQSAMKARLAEISAAAAQKAANLEAAMSAQTHNTMIDEEADDEESAMKAKLAEISAAAAKKAAALGNSFF